MASRDLKVTLIGDDRTGTAFGSAGNNADGLSTKFANLGKGIALALGGAAIAGVAGLGAALAQGVRDAASYQKITDQVAQTIRSTGAAAGVSVGGLKEYAGRLESLSGVDEELILSGQNVLLTFTNIRNAAGKGNDIFDQASEAALNLSTTMGGDLVGANTLVGKALNDPIAGMTALRRAGVQLSEQQQEQIKTMVESGDTMGAQKLLLGELETQFGGAAKAAGEGLTGSIARAKDAFQDMFRGIATALLPKLAELAQFFANTLMPGIKGIYDLVIGGDFTGALREAFGWEEDSAAVSFLVSLRENVMALWPHVKAAGAAMLDVASKVLPLLWSALQTVGSAVASVVGFFRQHDTAAKALGVVAGVVSGLVVAAWAVQAAAAVRGAVTSVNSWIAVATGAQVAKEGTTRSTAQIVAGWIAASASAVASAARQVAAWVLLGAQSLAQAARVAAAWVLAMGPVGWVIAAVVGLVALIVANWETVKRWTVTAWNAVSGAVSGAWKSITGAVSSGIASAVSFVKELPGKILGALGDMGSLLYNSGKNMIQGLLSGAGSLLRNIGRFFLDLVPGWIRKPFEMALGISSPSKVFAGYGKNIGQGLINGMGGMQPAIAAQMAALADTQSMASLVGMSSRVGRLGPASPTVSGAGLGAGIDYERLAAAVTSRSATLQIENFNAAHQTPDEVAEAMSWKFRTGS